MKLIFEITLSDVRQAREEIFKNQSLIISSTKYALIEFNNLILFINKIFENIN